MRGYPAGVTLGFLLLTAVTPIPAAEAPRTNAAPKVIPHGMLLHAPATQPACSKLPVSYELGSCFQLDRTRCLLVSNMDEQGGPDLCIGNDAFVFEKFSDIKPEKAIVINRAEPEYRGPGQTTTSFLAKYPVSGFFVPLGAMLPNGRPHPGAGSGLLLSVCVAYAADRSDPTTAGQKDANWKSWETLVEFIQIRWDGKKLTITDSRKVRELLGQPLFSGPFSHMAAMDEGFVGPCQFGGGKCRVARFEWSGGEWKAVRLGELFTLTDVEMEPTIQRDGDRYLVSTRDDKTPKVRIYSSRDGLNYKFLFESKNHYVPRSLNRGLDGSLYLATNPGPGFLRNPLLAYPLVGDAFGEPITIHDQDGVRNDKGASIPFVDHGQSANVFLEGQWRHLIFYRVCDLKERTLYGFQKSEVTRLLGPNGPIPKRPTSGVYVAELKYDAIVPPFKFASE